MTNISDRIDQLHLWFRQNRWLWIFTICTRILLSAGFLAAGSVKIMGERFTDLNNNQPMGHYLQALFETGYYYTFIGILQVLAATLLLFSRTVVLGVMIYLPIILNICILSWSVRFEGSLFTSPLMVIACVYLLWWNYDRVKYILPFNRDSLPAALPKQTLNIKFPWVFAFIVAITLVVALIISINVFDVVPRNTIGDCQQQFKGTNRTEAGMEFCDCIHTNGNPINKCMVIYFSAANDKNTNPKK